MPKRRMQQHFQLGEGSKRKRRGSMYWQELETAPGSPFVVKNAAPPKNRAFDTERKAKAELRRFSRRMKRLGNE